MIFSLCQSTIAADMVVKKIVIDGLKRTEQEVVIRELPFSLNSIWQADFRKNSERRLRSTGIFSEVHVSAPDKQGQVTIYLKERWSLWLLPQASRKDNGATSASAVLDEYNLWGLNHHIRLAYKQSTGKNFSSHSGYSYDGSYDWRRVADSKLSISIGGSHNALPYEAFSPGIQSSSYWKRSKSGSLIFSYGLGDVPSEGWTTIAGLTGSNTQYHLLSGTAQSDVIGSRIRTILLGISYSKINDHLTWLTGKAFNYTIALSNKHIGSTVNSYSHTASWHSHRELSGDNTLNLRLNGGFLIGDRQHAALFDIGNRDGIRGYYPGDLQASQYLYGTIEGRFPIQRGSNFQLVAFSDLGKISGTTGTPLAPGLAIGVGTGFRWTLRWLVNGTIRGDVAYGFAAKRWRFYIGSGQTF
ncbi:MAG: POTRA domain-containing protein [Mariprofundus sp.]|nr:POTRA domain-containing protein [Mariprofundus sp.]